MAEDQGVNGDRWNDQATRLFRKLNWESLGDSNIDIPTSTGKNQGVDRLFMYTESKKFSYDEGVIIEAKNYKTTSFSVGLLDGWIKIIDTKINSVKNSGDFFAKFPMMDGKPLRTGLIVIWFSDIHAYINFKEKFWQDVSKIQMYRKSATSNRIYILDNDAIIKLASLCISVDKINKRDLKRKLQFYYPSSDVSSARRSVVLNPNYMMSKFILADYIDKQGIENKVVFFFGRINVDSFSRLKQALSVFGYLDADKPLIIFTYLRDDSDSRKIMPIIQSLFKENQLTIEEMENMIDLPTFMRTDDE